MFSLDGLPFRDEPDVADLSAALAKAASAGDGKEVRRLCRIDGVNVQLAVDVLFENAHFGLALELLSRPDWLKGRVVYDATTHSAAIAARGTHEELRAYIHMVSTTHADPSRVHGAIENMSRHGRDIALIDEIVAAAGARGISAESLYSACLIGACASGDLGRVRRAVKRGGGGDFRGALLAACTGGQLAVVKQLIAWCPGLAPHGGAPEDNFSMCIHEAARSGNLALVKYLIGLGAPTRGALYSAYGAGRTEIVEFLLPLAEDTWRVTHESECGAEVTKKLAGLGLLDVAAMLEHGVRDDELFRWGLDWCERKEGPHLVTRQPAVVDLFLSAVRLANTRRIEMLIVKHGDATPFKFMIDHAFYSGQGKIGYCLARMCPGAILAAISVASSDNVWSRETALLLVRRGAEANRLGVRFTYGEIELLVKDGVPMSRLQRVYGLQAAVAREQLTDDNARALMAYTPLPRDVAELIAQY